MRTNTIEFTDNELEVLHDLLVGVVSMTSEERHTALQSVKRKVENASREMQKRLR